MDLGSIVHAAHADEVAAIAAADAVRRLRTAIAKRGKAVWVLAGGSSPMAAYRLLVEGSASAVDWSHVTVIIGDERMVPFSDVDSNLGTIARVLLDNPRMAGLTVLWPEVETDPDDAARDYAQSIAALPVADGAPIIDLAWLGVGEDGHTLSLFPGRADLHRTRELVAPVRDSPKPPAIRVTLTPAAFDRVGHVVIFATGAGKRDALAKALRDGELPISKLAARAREAGAEVSWLFDAAAVG